MSMVLLGLALAAAAFWWGRRRRTQEAYRLYEERRLADGMRQVDARIEREPAMRHIRGTNPPTVSSGRYRIGYADVNGVITERHITNVRADVRYGLVYIEAFCDMRGERRTFRADRIVDLRDEAGVGIRTDPVEHFGALIPRDDGILPGGFQESVATEIEAEHRRAMGHVAPGLSVLIWIARTDYDVDATEMSLLKGFAAARHALVQAKTEQALDEFHLQAWIDDAAPTKATCLKALSDLKPTSRARLLLAEYAARIVASSGDIDAKKEARRRQLFG